VENKMSLSLCTAWVSLLSVKTTYLKINEKGYNSSALRSNRVNPVTEFFFRRR